MPTLTNHYQLGKSDCYDNFISGLTPNNHAEAVKNATKAIIEKGADTDLSLMDGVAIYNRHDYLNGYAEALLMLAQLHLPMNPKPTLLARLKQFVIGLFRK